MFILATIHGVDYAELTDIQTRIHEVRAEIRAKGESDGRVTELNALEKENETIKRRRALLTAKPVFYAYYRTATGRKGYREFDSRGRLDSFVSTTRHAVTAHN